MFDQFAHVQLAQPARVSCIIRVVHIRGALTLTNITKLPMFVTAADGMLYSPSAACGMYKLSCQHTAENSCSAQ